MKINPAYRDYGNDADVFGVFPEFVSRDDSGVVNQSKGEDQQTEQLHQHGGLEHRTLALRQSEH